MLAAVALLVPWRPLPLHGLAPTPADPERDFTAAQIAREEAFHAAVRPPAYVSLGVGLLVAVVLGFTPAGARLVSAVAAPFGGGWWARVLLGTVALTLVGRPLTLPWDAWRESVRRRYGLSTRSWGAWAVDVAKSYGVGLVADGRGAAAGGRPGPLAAGVVVGDRRRRSARCWWCSCRSPTRSWSSRSSTSSPRCRTARCGRRCCSWPGRTACRSRTCWSRTRVRRTSSLNAYVSGIGATRRIVVYDTLVEQAPPEEVRLIVAHELGHAKQHDVRVGDRAGRARASRLLVCLLALLGRWPWLLGRAGVDVARRRPRGGPGARPDRGARRSWPGRRQNLLSRRIETRADVHALDLTHDPARRWRCSGGCR